jgi:hypothetical protein
MSPVGGAQMKSWRGMFGEPESASSSSCSPGKRGGSGNKHNNLQNQDQNRPHAKAGGAGKGGWLVPPLALGSAPVARCGDRAPNSARLRHAREPLRRRSLSDGDEDGVDDR